MLRVLLFSSLTLLAACGESMPHKVAFAGSTAQLQSGCVANFQDAWAREHELKVKLWVQNLSQDYMIVNRDGFALRLPDGRVLRRTGAVHNAYMIAPGGGHEVFVDFRDDGVDMRTYPGASLIVGGVSFGTDPRQRVVGEVPLLPVGEHR